MGEKFIETLLNDKHLSKMATVMAIAIFNRVKFYSFTESQLKTMIDPSLSGLLDELIDCNYLIKENNIYHF